MADPKSPADEFDSALKDLGVPENGGSQHLEAPVESDDLQNTESDEQENEGVVIGGRTFYTAEEADKEWRRRDDEFRKVAEERKKFEAALKERDKWQDDHKDELAFAKYMKENPDFNKDVSGIWHQKYAQARAAGDTKKEASKEADKAVSADPRVNEMYQYYEQQKELEIKRQADAEDAALRTEMEDLKKSYGLDQDKLIQVMDMAHREFDGRVPLKKVYRLMAADNHWKTAKAQADAIPVPNGEHSEAVAPKKTLSPEEEYARGLGKLGLN